MLMMLIESLILSKMFIFNGGSEIRSLHNELVRSKHIVDLKMEHFKSVFKNRKLYINLPCCLVNNLNMIVSGHILEAGIGWRKIIESLVKIGFFMKMKF